MYLITPYSDSRVLLVVLKKNQKNLEITEMIRNKVMVGQAKTQSHFRKVSTY